MFSLAVKFGIMSGLVWDSPLRIRHPHELHVARFGGLQNLKQARKLNSLSEGFVVAYYSGERSGEALGTGSCYRQNGRTLLCRSFICDADERHGFAGGFARLKLQNAGQLIHAACLCQSKFCLTAYHF